MGVSGKGVINVKTQELTTEEVSGGMASLPRGNERIEQMNVAKAALERADAAELYEVYKNTVRDRAATEKALTAIVNHYVGDKKEPRYEPNESAIDAMARVALAAIALAEKVATTK
jgi:hypothetical protein